jgi:uncharacterized integral membrane protein
VRTVLLVLIALLSLIMVIFGVQNTQAVTVRFLFFESGQVPAALVMVLSAIAGAALVGLFWLSDQVRFGVRRWRMDRQLAGVEKRAAELERQLATVTEEKAALAARAAEPTTPPAAPPATPPAAPNDANQSR